MHFLKVTAQQCNPQGLVAQGGTQRTELHLNIAQISGIIGNRVMVGSGTIISIGGNFYTNIQLATGVQIP